MAFAGQMPLPRSAISKRKIPTPHCCNQEGRQHGYGAVRVAQITAKEPPLGTVAFEIGTSEAWQVPARR
jgi:hypothetical protein